MPAPILPAPPSPPRSRRGLPSTDQQPEVVAAPGLALAPLPVAALFEHPAHLASFDALRLFAASIGAPLDAAHIPASLARGGTVGRIGVPREAVVLTARQRLVLGATVGADPLSPVARLWRGLHRRADVFVDVRQCTTLRGSAADRAGKRRDVLLFSQRPVDTAPRRRRVVGAHPDSVATEWARARDAADLACRLAAAEQRTLLLVLPVGRGTESQQYFADALERQARQHRMPAPRTVKAGLLAAMLSGDSATGRWLVASVIGIEDLSHLVCEAIGDTGPWPVISLGRDVTFIDMPAEPTGDLLPLLLAFSTMLQRSGRGDLARTLVQATVVTTSAVTRMREELGGELTVPPVALLQGVLANWGRTAPAEPSRERRAAAEASVTVTGLRFRVETSLTAAAVRDRLAALLLPTGLELASVRSSEVPQTGDVASYDVRVRSRLGEPALGDATADVVSAMLRDDLRCVLVEPWSPSAPVDKPRARAG